MSFLPARRVTGTRLSVIRIPHPIQCCGFHITPNEYARFSGGSSGPQEGWSAEIHLNPQIRMMMHLNSTFTKHLRQSSLNP